MKSLTGFVSGLIFESDAGCKSSSSFVASSSRIKLQTVEYSDMKQVYHDCID